MANMKVSMKLMVGFGAGIVLTVILSVYAIASSMSVDEHYTHLLEYNEGRLIAVHEVAEQFWVARRSLSHTSIYAGFAEAESNIRALLGTIDQSLTVVNEKLDFFIHLVLEDDNLDEVEKNEKIAVANHVKRLAAQWRSEFVAPFVQANLDGRRQDVIILTNGTDVANDLFNSVDELIIMVDKTTDAMVKRIEAEADRSMIILIALAVAVVCISAGFAVMIPRSITKPLAALSAFMKHAGTTGDIELKAEDIEIIGKYGQVRDEIGETISSTAFFIEHVTLIAQKLETIASGDLTVDVELLSDKDKMGVSLQRMLASLNQMFGDINASTSQVSTGSKQIADGAQSLAQGSTQQAASIEELSSTISEISRMAKENADTATETLSDVQMAGSLMDVCMEQMLQMTEAMQTIDEKSKNITKTTKVIDDIAFQTNILALNAAVEAARAGQHGKGFAVVAEEVRNLASKSAEAAKETAALIESSSQSVGEGNRIVEKVSESLHAVAEIEHKNTLQTERIQSISAQQSAAMEQVNIGIDQVAQVVQQNSATAEESAAASEEMSAQSTMLEDLMRQFKVRQTAY